MDVRSWCQENSAEVRVLEQATKALIALPKVVGSPPYRLEAGAPDVPAIYLATIPNGTVIGGSSLVLTANGVGLSDEIALSDGNYYAQRLGPLKKLSNGQAKAVLAPPAGVTISEAITLCKGGASNYFHWLIECLPKLEVVDAFPELNNVPIIIDDGLPKQLVDALKMIDKNKRPLLTIEKNRPAVVGSLYVVSDLSIFNDNYDNPVRIDDIVISPRAAKFVRKRLARAPSGIRRKFYLSRSKASYRKIRNNDVIQSYLEGLGFETVNPDEMSFDEQLDLFSQAGEIVGASGAALANMLFAPADCRVTCLVSNNSQSNLYFYSSIANYIGLQFQYVLGPEIKGTASRKYAVHNDFSIPLDRLQEALEWGR